MIQRIFRKIGRDGPVKTAKTIVQVINFRLFQADWDFKIVPNLLEEIVSDRRSLAVVQIGANVGNTGSDQIYEFLKKWCHDEPGKSSDLAVTAILVEPVRHLFVQLQANYEGFRGIACENVAIADRTCTRHFYRLRAGIDLNSKGLPPFAEELGSFLPEQMNSLWSHDPDNQELREFVAQNTVVDDISCLSIHDLADKHSIGKIDFLQVDTEGYDYEILRTIDFNKLAPENINYERIHLKKDEAECRKLLVRNGYRLHDHGQDTLAKRTFDLNLIERVRESIYCVWLKLVY
jgi:FkbM family methyltransferase